MERNRHPIVLLRGWRRPLNVRHNSPNYQLPSPPPLSSCSASRRKNPAWWSHPCLLSCSDSDQMYLCFISARQKQTKPSEPQREPSAQYWLCSPVLPKSFDGQNMTYVWESTVSLKASHLLPWSSVISCSNILPCKPCLPCSLKLSRWTTLYNALKSGHLKSKS